MSSFISTADFTSWVESLLADANSATSILPVDVIQDYFSAPVFLGPLFLLILLDILGIPDLWGERLFRRVLHHAATGSRFPWRVLNAPVLIGLRSAEGGGGDLDKGSDTTVKRRVSVTSRAIGGSRSKSPSPTKRRSSITGSPKVVAKEQPALLLSHQDEDTTSNTTRTPKSSISALSPSTSSSSLRFVSQTPLHPEQTTVLRREDVEKVLHMCETNGPQQKYFREVQGLNTKSAWLSKMAGGQFSTRATLYFNDFTPEGKQIMLDVGESLREPLARVLGLADPSSFHLGSSDFKCCLLRYEGQNANFGFHYDTEPWNCFRCLFLIKRSASGEVAPFLYYDFDGRLHKVPLNEVGDGLVFQGTRVMHGVQKTGDSESIRYMLGFQYRVGDEDLESSRKNFCNQFRGTTSLVGKAMEVFGKCVPVLLLNVAIFASSIPGFISKLFFGGSAGEDLDLVHLLRQSLSTALTNASVTITQLFFRSSRSAMLVAETTEDVLDKLYTPFAMVGDCVEEAKLYPGAHLPRGQLIAASLLIIFAFTKSTFVRSLPFFLYGASPPSWSSSSGKPEDQEKTRKILDQALPFLQTQATPRLLSCWLIPLVSLVFVAGLDLTLIVSFAAYLCLTEHCLPSTWMDVLYEDKRKSLRIVRTNMLTS
ncbi:unnamed protein product [Amoebophrya sp. A25]|nr:unnamed protein product [Amoebophrya sp. A25]|eukprot:GSA25T00001246001.1